MVLIHSSSTIQTFAASKTSNKESSRRLHLFRFFSSMPSPFPRFDWERYAPPAAPIYRLRLPLSSFPWLQLGIRLPSSLLHLARSSENSLSSQCQIIDTYIIDAKNLLSSFSITSAHNMIYLQKGLSMGLYAYLCGIPWPPFFLFTLFFEQFLMPFLSFASFLFICMCCWLLRVNGCVIAESGSAFLNCSSTGPYMMSTLVVCFKLRFPICLIAMSLLFS